MTVPVRATRRTEPFEKTYSPLSAMPSVLSSVLSVAAKLTSPLWFRSYVASEKPALTNVPPPGMASPGRATAMVVPLEKRKTPRASPMSGVADEDDVASAIHDGPKSQAEDDAARRRVALMS